MMVVGETSQAQMEAPWRPRCARKCHEPSRAGGRPGEKTAKARAGQPAAGKSAEKLASQGLPFFLQTQETRCARRPTAAAPTPAGGRAGSSAERRGADGAAAGRVEMEQRRGRGSSGAAPNKNVKVLPEHPLSIALYKFLLPVTLSPRIFTHVFTLLSLNNSALMSA